MSGPQAQLAAWLAQARARRVQLALLLVLPPACALLVLAWRIGHARAAGSMLVLALVALAFALRSALRGDLRREVAQRLDAQAAQLEDSSDLLWREQASLSALQRLQRERLQARLAQVQADVRAPWPRRWLAGSAGLALAILVLAALWPAASQRLSAHRARTSAPDSVAALVVATRIDIEPPAYTGLPVRRESGLDLKVVEGSRLRWRLRLDGTPSSVQLEFHDGSRLALAREGGEWTAQRVLDASSLYRIALDGGHGASGDLHRIDVTVDHAPVLRIITPAQTLSLHGEGQQAWPLEFEAADDYGLAKAELVLTHAQGSGENVAFKEQVIALQGTAVPAAERAADPALQGGVTLRYRHVVDLAALGLAAGDELIARLIASDNRAPQPNTTRSAAVILRWPAQAAAEGSGLEGIVQQVMPAYFRSQRQIIIDTQALIAERARMAPEALLTRSDAIGVDQKILRLRYGQFLGEESEGQAHAAVEAGQAQEDSQLGALAATHETAEQAHASDQGFGKAGDVVAQYGHVHDIAEAATLLDAQTRATLKSALDAMWQAEGKLRGGEPEGALPFEERALEFIKQAQQATRIYLARVGLELPAPDEKRRLTGEREGLDDRAGSLAAREDPAAPLARLWHVLGSAATPDWDAARQALAQARSDQAQRLDALAALDKAQRDPGCDVCRARLRERLWPLLDTPAARVIPRAAPDAAGAAYLDALAHPAEPPR